MKYSLHILGRILRNKKILLVCCKRFGLTFIGEYEMKSTVYYASEYSSEPNKRAGPNKRAVLNRRAGRNFAQNTKKECRVKTGIITEACHK